MPANIDAERELIIQDRHVTYHEIEASLSNSSILPEHLAVKKISSRWIRHNLTIAQKKALVEKMRAQQFSPNFIFFKYFFQVTVNNTNDGRISKRPEYDYA